MIRDHYETRWGSIELVRATLALLDDALRDDPALVAFASETRADRRRRGRGARIKADDVPAVHVPAGQRLPRASASGRRSTASSRPPRSARRTSGSRSPRHARACAALDACVRRAARAAARATRRRCGACCGGARRPTSCSSPCRWASCGSPAEHQCAGHGAPRAGAFRGHRRQAPDLLRLVARRHVAEDLRRAHGRRRRERRRGCLFARKVAAAVDEATWAALVLRRSANATTTTASPKRRARGRACGGGELFEDG